MNPSIRFIIRRDVKDEYHHWSLRDALCKNVERHDFAGPDWADDCDGACDTFKFFSSAIGTASEAAGASGPPPEHSMHSEGEWFYACEACSGLPDGDRQ